MRPLPWTLDAVDVVSHPLMQREVRREAEDVAFLDSLSCEFFGEDADACFRLAGGCDCLPGVS